jgi:dihydroorotase
MELEIHIRNGHVIDPFQGIDEIVDVGVIGNKLVALDSTKHECEKTVDAAGCHVLPGLIDYHTHIYYRGSGESINPAYMISNGVTATQVGSWCASVGGAGGD